MLENTDKAFGELINKLSSMIEGASGHLPEIAEQMLVQGTYEASWGLSFGIALLAVAVLSFLVAAVVYDGWFAGIIGVIFLFFGGNLIFDSILTSHKIEHAPKLYLLDQAAGYVKTNR